MSLADRGDLPDVIFSSSDGSQFALHAVMLRLRWPLFKRSREDAISRIARCENADIISVLEYLYAGSPVHENMRSVMKVLDLTFPTGDTTVSYRNAMAELLKSRADANFTIECKGQKIRVHRFVLAIRSDFFAGMFASEMNESQTGIHRDRYADGADAMSAFVEFLYTGDGQFRSLSDLYALVHLCKSYDVHEGYDGETAEFVAARVLHSFGDSVHEVKSWANTHGHHKLCDLLGACDV